MTTEFKQALSKKVSERIDSTLPQDDSGVTKLIKTISDIAIKATLITLEEYENLKDE